MADGSPRYPYEQEREKRMRMSSRIDRFLGPQIGPPQMGFFSRAWRFRLVGRVLEPWRMRKYRRLTKGTRWELDEKGNALWSQASWDARER